MEPHKVKIKQEDNHEWDEFSCHFLDSDISLTKEFIKSKNEVPEGFQDYGAFKVLDKATTIIDQIAFQSGIYKIVGYESDGRE